MDNKQVTPVPVCGFPRYFVDGLGFVWSNTSGKMRRMRPYGGGRGYHQVSIFRNGLRFRRYVHRLVASAFVPAKNGTHVNHKNGIKRDNRAENLEWVTPKENTRHAASLGLIPVGDRLPQSKLNNGRVIRIRRSFSELRSIAAVARLHRISEGTARQVVLRETWKHI